MSHEDEVKVEAQAPIEFDYKILEAQADPFESTIEKSGIKAKFTLNEIKQHQDYLQKQLTNLSTKLMAHNAQIILLTNRHPEYADIPEENWVTCAAYCSKKVENIQLEQEIEVTKKEIEIYQTEFAHMLKVLDIKAIDPKELEPTPEEKTDAQGNTEKPE